MSSFFKNKAKDKEINQLIFDVVEYNRESDEKELFSRMKDLELYTPIVKANFEIENEKAVRLEKGMEVALQYVTIDNSKVGLFFVNKNDTRLTNQFVALTRVEVFNMIEQLPDLNGFIFYNNQEYSFGIPKNSFSIIRKKYNLYW